MAIGLFVFPAGCREKDRGDITSVTMSTQEVNIAPGIPIKFLRKK